jgi:peroxiredoxin
LAALEPGEVFPQVELETGSGDRFIPPGSEALYGFFKTTCPASELAWPHFDRIRRIGEGGLRTFAVSQDSPAETRDFNARLRVGLETLYDPEPWKASAALGLTNVPTFFLVGLDGKIMETAVGFQRPKLEKFARRAGKLAGRSRVRLFPIGEVVPLIVPG